MKVDWTLEELFYSTLGGWDVEVEVLVESNEPEPEVGYRGGPYIDGFEVVAFVEYDGKGREIRRLNKNQMEDNDALLCDYLMDLAEKQILAESDQIFNTAANISQSEREYALEMRYEAKREFDRYGY